MDLHRQFVKYGAEALKWRRKCEILLPEIAQKQIWKKKKYGSIYEYAAKLAGMSRNKVNECLRISEHIEDKPELREVAEKKGLWAVKPVATIATQEDAGFWAKRVETMPKSAVEKLVQHRREERRPGAAAQPEKSTISLKLTPELARKLDKLKHRDDFEELLDKFVDSLEEKKPEAVESESRYIPARIQQYIRSKTADRCACCNRKAEVLHHANRFAKHHKHDPDHLIPLCKGHHQLAHLGYVENEHDPPEKWQFRRQPQSSSIDLKWQQYASIGT